LIEQITSRNYFAERSRSLESRGWYLKSVRNCLACFTSKRSNLAILEKKNFPDR